MSAEDHDLMEFNADPRKEYMVDIITRDVEIIKTIQEFVDNSIDGAVREEGDISNKWVELELSDEEIVVEDNCGGIPQEIAQNYAFRFGPPDEDILPSRIGEFGIGMKRSLFKLGKKFVVESHHEGEQPYKLEVDVQSWLLDEDDWGLDGEIIPEEEFSLDTYGTRIYIPELTEEAKAMVGNQQFIGDLEDKFESDFRSYIRDGFDIILNGRNLGYRGIEIYSDGNVNFGYRNFKYRENGAEAEVELIVGISEADPSESGWYVVCNGRSLLEANTDSITGWSGDNIPAFHNQFNRFRGIVSFSSEDSGILPWNTTKTGVNSDTNIYQTTLQEMTELMRQIIDCANEIRNQQRDLPSLETGENTPLEDLIEDNQMKDIIELVEEVDEDVEEIAFEYPKTPQGLLEEYREDIDEDVEEEEGEETEFSYISYRKNTDRVESIKDEFGVDTNKEAGEETFELAYAIRVGEDDG